MAHLPAPSFNRHWGATRRLKTAETTPGRSNEGSRQVGNASGEWITPLSDEEIFDRLPPRQARLWLLIALEQLACMDGLEGGFHELFLHPMTPRGDPKHSNSFRYN